MSESCPLAIIGISCLFPKADDLQGYWANIKNGVDAISPIPERSHWAVADYFDQDPKAPDRTFARRGGFLSPVDFNPMEFGIAPKDLEATDTTQLLGLVAAKQALVDAGYGSKPFPRERTSVILGVTGALELVIPLGARLGHPIWRRALKEAGVAEPIAADVVQRIADGYVNWQENSFPGLLGNVAAGRIANRLDLGGTNCVVDAACASSLAALHLGALELASGRSDMVISGGVDTFNDIFMFMCFTKTPALSPSGDAKPFDRTCDGTILGEGVGMVVLKRLADAERDGDKIYAVIKGMGSSSDGKGNAIYAPRAEGQRVALCRAYEESKVTPDTIELVEAHGTGTRVGDTAEVQALTGVFRDARSAGTWAALGSVKSQIGHAKAAAGVAGLIKAALALDRKVLPPTVKVSQPIDEAAPGRSPFYVNTLKRPWLPRPAHPRRAGVSAFGFGGTNFHCVLEEHGANKTAPDWDGDVEIMAWSSDRREELRAQVAALPNDLPWVEVRRRAWQSRQVFSPTAPFRLLLPLAKTTALVAVRDAAVRMLDKHPEKTSWVLPTGVAFGSGERSGKLGAMFPGQGSQYVGMMRDLACQFPGMLDVLSAADQVFASEQPAGSEQRLSDFIYPHPAFNDETRHQQEDALKSTDVAQPALGVMGLGALSVLGYFDVLPEAAAGHSYGELLALCGAGRLEPEALHRLSNIRGRLMANRNGHGDRGAMLAVQASEETVLRFVREQQPQLVIANRNSPNQFVLAGPKAQVGQAAAELAKQSVRARVLPVSAAFHSPLVADAREPFAAALEQVPFHDGRIPVYANTTGQAYPPEAERARALLAGQIANPVDFLAEIKAMHADGVTTFLEIGPGHVLTDLVQAILQGREIETIALDASKGTRSGTFDLAVALCRLAALGHGVNLLRWEQPVAPPKAVGKLNLTVSLTGANYRAPSVSRPPVVPPQAPEPRPRQAGALPRQGPEPVSPMPAPTGAIRSASPAPASELRPDLATALQVAQQGILSLQKLQEQTAQLHRQFLENQDAARRTIETLLAQRRELLHFPAGVAQTVGPATASSATPGPRLVAPLPVRPAAPIPAVQPAPVAAASVSAPAAIEVTNTVLAVVAEKTGYPAEMLSLSMGLDSDLGIDSIKRVEIMAALRGRLPAAPEIKPEHLGTLQTLQQVVDFLGSSSASASGSPAPAVSTKSTVTPDAGLATREGGVDSARASAALLAVVAEKTGYPIEMLNLEMGLDSDLGVDSIKRVEIMAALRTALPGAPEIKPEHLGTLQTLRQVVEFLAGGQASSRAGDAAGTVPAAPASGRSDAANGTALVDPARATAALLEVVADKTGYPVEMLNLDMGLDSDLGVDSIKRVEIMAALRALLPAAPEIKPEHLGTLQTLKQVVDFLTAAPVSPPSPAVAENSFVAAPAGRPVAMPATEVAPHRQLVRPVELSDSEGRSAVVLPANARIWVTEDGSDLARAVEERLKQLGYVVRRDTPAELCNSPRKESPAGLVILWPASQGNDAALKAAFRLIQVAGPSLRRVRGGQGGLLVSVSRLDGVFGFGSLNGNGDPVSGGLAGLVKTARHEWPEVHCKAIDLNPEITLGPETANAIVDEMFRVGPIEVGLSGTSRFGLELETVPLTTQGASSVLSDGDVVVVTGGARGITAAVTLRLACDHRLKLVLLGRSQLVEEEPEWLAEFADEAALKKALLARSGQARSPKELEAEYREVMAQREIREHLRRLRQTGAQALYRSVDVRRAADVAGLLQQVRKDVGPIRGVIHGAGVLADRRIEDKTAEQFDLVYSTKVLGLENLLRALASDQLNLLALFSSYTGRYGRTGQVDYAAANEVLNKMAQRESRRRPQCRVVSFNWGPWNGGMVSSGLRKIFETEGVGLIEPKAGAEFFVREIASRAERPVEVLAVALTGKRNSNGSTLAAQEQSPVSTVAFEREVSVASLPCLESHVLNGRAVLPAALMIEWLAHGAVHGNPGMAFHGFERFKVLKGLVLEPQGSVNVSLLAEPGRMEAGLLHVPVQLVSRSGSRTVLHARAEVVLAEVLPTAPESAAQAVQANNGHHAVYGNGHLFHGQHFHGIETLEACSKEEMAALVRSAPAPRQWIRDPLRPAWMSDPLALDSSFQMMILWSWEHRQAGSLPCAIRRFRQYASAFPRDGIRVVIRIDSAETPVVTANLQFFDRQGRLLALAEGYECVVDEGLGEAFRRNRLHEG